MEEFYSYGAKRSVPQADTIRHLQAKFGHKVHVKGASKGKESNFFSADLKREDWRRSARPRLFCTATARV